MSFWSKVTTLGAGIGAGLGTAYDYATPGKGSSRLTDSTYNYFMPTPSYSAPVSKPKTQASTGTSGPDLEKIYNDALAKAMAASRANQPPVPRMINFDIGGSWDKARQMATNAVSPIYQQKLNDFIGRQQTELQRQQTDTSTQKSALDTALAQFITDSNTTRQRTTEDTNANITDVNAQQAANDRSEGLSFDQANRSLNESLGAGNVADTGLGQQAVTEGQKARDIASNEQLRQSTEKVDAANTLMNRTFDDLTTGTTRKTDATNTGKGQLDLNMERFIEDQSYNLDQEQKQENLSKEADIAQQQIGYQGQLVDQWLASLSGKGYTAQEIANAASIYK